MRVCHFVRFKLRLARGERHKKNYDALGLGKSFFASTPVRGGFVRDESNQQEFDFKS